VATMTAYRLHTWGCEAELVEVPVPQPGPRDVLLRVGGAGACQSDLHLMHQFDAATAPWPAGFVLGHENAGWVAEAGAEVRGFAEGEAVAVLGAWGCGSCPRCRFGMETLCDRPDLSPAPRGGGGLGLDGGMAEYMVVRDADRHLVALPSDLAPSLAAPLSDAALTPYHAVRRSLPKLADPHATALVVGVGGLGSFAVQVLEALTSATVIAVDPRQEALALATADGAEHVLPPAAETATTVRELTDGRGVDVVLDFVGSSSTLELAAAVVRPLGDLTLVGAGGGTAQVGFGVLPYEVSVQTTFWGSRDELRDVVALAARGALRSRVTTYPLAAAAAAYRDLSEGRVSGRAVVVP
jgi:propanol-preferring alcohol dehydrogenase